MMVELQLEGQTVAQESRSWHVAGVPQLPGGRQSGPGVEAVCPGVRGLAPACHYWLISGGSRRTALSSLTLTLPLTGS